MKKTVAEQRHAIVAEAIDWLGTPYHHSGKLKGVGVDCGQLLIGVYAGAGIIDDINTGDYARDWHFHRSDEQYLKWVLGYATKTETPQAGDIALFKFGRCISHGAIVVDMPTLIHAHIGRGCVYIDINDAEIAGRLAGFYTVFKE